MFSLRLVVTLIQVFHLPPGCESEQLLEPISDFFGGVHVLGF